MEFKCWLQHYCELLDKYTIYSYTFLHGKNKCVSMILCTTSFEVPIILLKLVLYPEVEYNILANFGPFSQPTFTVVYLQRSRIWQAFFYNLYQDILFYDLFDWIHILWALEATLHKVHGTNIFQCKLTKTWLLHLYHNSLPSLKFTFIYHYSQRRWHCWS